MGKIKGKKKLMGNVESGFVTSYYGINFDGSLKDQLLNYNKGRDHYSMKGRDMSVPILSSYSLF
jgi:hypothetical protein